jgi:molecular chaperone DnaK (HSP70)
MGKVVGIDLGTTNSLVAYVQDGRPVVIRDAGGDAIVP